MNIETEKDFQDIVLTSKDGKISFKIKRTRTLIGRAQACDCIIPISSVSSIHAVLEVSNNQIRIYDMNSKNGTQLNGKKIIAESVKVGDVLTIANYDLTIKLQSQVQATPPVLDMLDEQKTLPTAPAIAPAEASTPAPEAADIPEVVFPLSNDPKAEFSEYIFEDADILYPVFKYQVDKSSAEIIIVHNDRVFSVDFLPSKDGVYRLRGRKSQEDGVLGDVEFPYLPLKDTVDFVDVKSGEITVYPIPGFKCYEVGSQEELKSGPVSLMNYDDMVVMDKGDISIYIRKTDAPPKIKYPPFMRLDSSLVKPFLIIFALLIPMMMLFGSLEIDKELEEEKTPERIATILYKKKLTVSKNKAVAKTKKAPKKIAQKSPQKKQLKPEKKPKVKKAKPKKPKKVVKTPGKKKAPKKLAKKATPNKGKRNKLVDKVRKASPKVAKKSAKSSSKKASASRRRARVNSKSRGHVDTYKATNFASQFNKLLAKGGSTSSISSTDSLGEANYQGESSSINVDSGATLKKAKVTGNVGSLSGVSKGKLDSSRGVQDLAGEKSIYTAGLPSKVVILGGMDPDQIRQILIDNIHKFRACYQNELNSASKSFNGIVKMDFLIGASGNVTRASIVSVDKNIPVNVRKCVRNVLMRISFPEPAGGGVVEVSQPFNFFPKNI